MKEDERVVKEEVRKALKKMKSGKEWMELHMRC